MPEHTIGADISKDHIDLYRLKDGARLKAANDRKGFAAILKWIGNEVVDRIVYEPTGPYHRAFERFMAVRGLTLSKVNPLSARRFCEARGQLAKTDRIDAKMLALFGALLDPRILEPGSETIHDLKELHMARLALVKDRTAAKNREKSLTQAILKQQNAARLKQIDTQIKALDKAITALITSDEDLNRRHDIIVSIPGLSSITAFALLIEMPELKATG